MASTLCREQKIERDVDDDTGSRQKWFPMEAPTLVEVNPNLRIRGMSWVLEADGWTGVDGRVTNKEDDTMKTTMTMVDVVQQQHSTKSTATPFF